MASPRFLAVVIAIKKARLSVLYNKDGCQVVTFPIL
jgi:hypothetical protein